MATPYSSVITALNHNFGTYSDYVSARTEGMSEDECETAIKDLRFVRERNILLKRYLQKLAHEEIDIITLQEVYGFNLEAETAPDGIRWLISEYLKNYQLVEETPVSKEKPGDAIILFNKKKFFLVESFSQPGRTIALLKSRDKKIAIIVASAHLPGYKINGPDAPWINGDGKKFLLELIRALSSKEHFVHKKAWKKAITIIGLDANAPPCGKVYTAIDDSKFQILSERVTFLTSHNFITGCPIDGPIVPSPTAINILVNGGVRLDYIWAKWPKGKITIREDLVKQKELAPYELKYYNLQEIPLILHADHIDIDKLPFSDHLPIYSEIFYTL